MRPLVLVLTFSVCLTLCSVARAQEIVWPEDVMGFLEWSADDLHQATTAEEARWALEALHADLVSAAVADAPGALTTLIILNAQLDGGRGLARIESGLARTALANPSMGVGQTVVWPSAQILAGLARIHRDSTLLPSTAHRVADTIAALDSALADMGAPPFWDQVEAVLGDQETTALLQEFRDHIEQAMDLYEDATAVAEGDTERVDDFVSGVLNTIPPSLAPAFHTPMGAMLADQLQWQQEMAEAATDGVETVADAIRTGAIDQERLNQVTERLEELSRGPWGSETARDYLRQWCGHLPIGADACEDVADYWEQWENQDRCEAAISCDCENTTYAFRDISIQQCKGYESQIIEACLEEGAIRGWCDPITSGPAAFPLRP